MTQRSIRRAAIKTGLTGRTVLPPTHDTPAYSAHLAEYEKEYRSQGARGFEFATDDSDLAARGFKFKTDNLARHGFEFSTATPVAVGFEFSTFDIDTHLEGGLQPTWGFSPTPSTCYRK